MSGFTLFEMMVVLLILGLLGGLSILKMEQPLSEDYLEEINELLYMAGEEALETFQKQKISIDRVKNLIQWKDYSISIKGDVDSIVLNGNNVYSEIVDFYVYTTRHSDNVEIRYVDKKEPVNMQSLALRFVYAKQ